MQTTGFHILPSPLLEQDPMQSQCPPRVMTSRISWLCPSVLLPGTGRYLMSHFSFSQNNLARKTSISLARICVQEEPRPPWSSFSSWDSSSWWPLWFSPSDSALQGGRWLIGKSSPVHSPQMLCECSGRTTGRTVPSRNWTDRCLVHQGTWTLYPRSGF